MWPLWAGRCDNVWVLFSSSIHWTLLLSVPSTEVSPSSSHCVPCSLYPSLSATFNIRSSCCTALAPPCPWLQLWSWCGGHCWRCPAECHYPIVTVAAGWTTRLTVTCWQSSLTACRPSKQHCFTKTSCHRCLTTSSSYKGNVFNAAISSSHRGTVINTALSSSYRGNGTKPLSEPMLIYC